VTNKVRVYELQSIAEIVINFSKGVEIAKLMAQMAVAGISKLKINKKRNFYSL
jgi:hypothetical protein